MMIGVVSAMREATVQLTIRGIGIGDITVDAVLDTGFNGYMTLPAAVISGLGLNSQGVRRAILGDGSAVVLVVYRAEVTWDGQSRPVQVLAAEGSALIGMALIQGHRVTLDVIAGGPLTIERLP